MSPDLIGTAAGILTTIAFIPQLVKTWRSRSADDVSLVMFLLFSTGVVLWIAYGILTKSVPIVVFNGITLGLSVTMIAFKIYFYHRPKK